jgi:hypothetical protein
MMNNNIIDTGNQITNSKMDTWFDDIIAQIKTDKFQLETQTADSEKTEMYNDLMTNNLENIFERTNKEFRMFHISNIVIKYLKELIYKLHESIDNIKIAFDFSDNKLLVWAVIPNDDEEVYEKALILAEAKVNADYFEKGFCVTSTIVSEEDDLTIPEQYKLLSN